VSKKQPWTEYVREQMKHFNDRRKWAAEWGYALLIALQDTEKKLEDAEEKLAEYENDETARRRADAYKIRQLENYKREVEEVAELMFQFAMRRINEKIPAGDG